MLVSSAILKSASAMDATTSKLFNYLKITRSSPLDSMQNLYVSAIQFLNFLFFFFFLVVGVWTAQMTTNMQRNLCLLALKKRRELISTQTLLKKHLTLMLVVPLLMAMTNGKLPRPLYSLLLPQGP